MPVVFWLAGPSKLLHPSPTRFRCLIALNAILSVVASSFDGNKTAPGPHPQMETFGIAFSPHDRLGMGSSNLLDCCSSITPSLYFIRVWQTLSQIPAGAQP